MITQADIMKQRWRIVYHMTPFSSMTNPELKVKNNLVFECNGDICDVFNAFMTNHQFAFKDYIIQIEYIVELPEENG